jgi:hypothetical protein
MVSTFDQRSLSTLDEGCLLRLGGPGGATNNAHSFSATQSATPSTLGTIERKLRTALNLLILLCIYWCCRRGLNSRPLPYQQQGAEPQGTPWGNVLLLLAFFGTCFSEHRQVSLSSTETRNFRYPCATPSQVSY